MDRLIEVAGQLFDRSPVAFSLVQVHLDENGEPYDASYLYINQAMADYTQNIAENMRGLRMYATWGNTDYRWLNRFYAAAYEGKASEFEGVSVMVNEVLNATVFPVAEGICGFVFNNVSALVSQVRASLENAEAAMFFYDMSANAVRMPQEVLDTYGFKSIYPGMVEFCEDNFDEATCQEMERQLTRFHEGKASILMDAQLKDGRWLRISLTHGGRTNDFAFGFLEDITKAKELELDAQMHLNVINSLSRENYALYLANLGEDTVRPYYFRDNLDADTLALFPDGVSCSAMLEICATKMAGEESEEELRQLMNRDHLREALATPDDEVAITVRRRNRDEYIHMRVLPLEKEDEVVIAFRDVSDEMLDERRRQLALEDALTLARQASNAKSSFLTNMSHDIRTPMNSIVGFANIATEHLDDRHRVDDCLRKIQYSSRHLLSLINDVLDMSRIESGKVQLNEAPYNLDFLQETLKDLFEGQARDRDIQLAIDFSAITDKAVIADSLRLSQIFVNLIGNALKFTEPGGHVEVRGEQRPEAPNGYGSYVFTVTDDGCGMSPEFVARVFEPFEREDSKKVRSIEGTGLGMPIVKNLIDMMGGVISVTSVEKEGTTFTFAVDLRLQESKTAAQEAGVRQPLDPRSEAGRGSAWGSSQGAAASEDQDLPRVDSLQTLEAPDAFTGLSVLVADDDALSREIMQLVLEEKGMTVTAVEDGKKAVECFSESETYFFDAILMDMHMPEMSGVEATRVIRGLDRPDAKDIPIVATTADAFEEDRMKAIQSGMNAHVSKPIDTKALLRLLIDLRRR